MNHALYVAEVMVSEDHRQILIHTIVYSLGLDYRGGKFYKYLALKSIRILQLKTRLTFAYCIYSRLNSKKTSLGTLFSKVNLKTQI